LSYIEVNSGQVLLSKISRGQCPKSFSHVITPNQQYVTWQSFMGLLHLAPKL